MVSKLNGILAGAWWLYVLAMAPFVVFSGGIEEFIMGFFAVIILFILPFVFMKD